MDTGSGRKEKRRKKKWNSEDIPYYRYILPPPKKKENYQVRPTRAAEKHIPTVREMLQYRVFHSFSFSIVNQKPQVQ